MTRGVCLSPKTYKRWMAARVIHGGYLGGKETPEHYIWRAMIIRCKGNRPHYKTIQVCKRWLVYENFLSDMGKRPSPKHTLDRYPNNRGDYKPSNCRWATYTQQIRNRTTTRHYTNGKRHGTLQQWAEWLGVSSSCVSGRWKRWGTLVKGKKFKRTIGDAYA